MSILMKGCVKTTVGSAGSITSWEALWFIAIDEKMFAKERLWFCDKDESTLSRLKWSITS